MWRFSGQQLHKVRLGILCPEFQQHTDVARSFHKVHLFQNHTEELCFDSRQGQVTFVFQTPIHSPTQSMAGDSLRRSSGRGLKVTTHLHLVTKLQMSGTILPFPHAPSWRAQGPLYHTGYTQTDVCHQALTQPLSQTAGCVVAVER